MREDDRPERPRMNTEEFAALVAAPLKASVPLDAGFDARVMAEIAAAAEATPWWRRRSIALSPLGGFVVAAGFGALMVLGGVELGRNIAAPGAPAAAVTAAVPDTVHVVRFVFAAPGARTVALAGDFNGWSREATPLEELAAGVWAVTVPLSAGLHEYAFVVDGERWEADPTAAVRRDEFGNASSILSVGGASVRGT